MEIVSVINYKGGVGKTTVTANLAAELAWRGYDILLIDLDPQASLTFSFIRPEEWESEFSGSRTIKNWFDAISNNEPFELNELIFSPSTVQSRLRNRGTLELIASHLGLINVDLELATELGGASLKQAKRNYLRVHRKIANGIENLNGNEYDVIFFDCPPNFNIVTKNAIVASDHILIPAKPDYLSTLGIDYLIRSLNNLISNYNEYVQIDAADDFIEIEPQILGVIFTMIQIYGGQPIAALRPYINQTRNLDIPVFDSYIKENKTIFADAPQYGVPVAIGRYSSGSHTSVVRGIESFVSEFEQRLGLEE